MQATTTIAMRCRFCAEAGVVAPALFLLGRDPEAVGSWVVLRPLGRAPSRADAEAASSSPATMPAEKRVRHLVPHSSRTEWEEWTYISLESSANRRAIKESRRAATEFVRTATEFGMRRSSQCPRCRRPIQFTLRQLVRLAQEAEGNRVDSVLVPEETPTT